MLRYVAIGAVVGFLIAYFLLSSGSPPPPRAEAPVPAPPAIPWLEPGARPTPLNLPRGVGRMPLQRPERQELPVASDGG